METNNSVRFAVPYAKRADGTEMRRSEAQEAREKGLRIPSLICPACGHGVAYRQEHARARGHFYHSDNSVGGGGCGLESEIHAAFKAAVAAELTENGLDTDLVRGWRGFDTDLTREWRRRGGVLRGVASVEEPIMDGAYRLDVSFWPDPEGFPPMAIEVVNMSALDSGKRDALHAEGWIVLTLQPKKMTPDERIAFWDALDRVAYARSLLPRLGYYRMSLQTVRGRSLANKTVSESDFECPAPPGGQGVSVAKPAPASAPKVVGVKPAPMGEEDLRRARALQTWHTNAAAFPLPFTSYELSDFENTTNGTTRETTK